MWPTVAMPRPALPEQVLDLLQSQHGLISLGQSRSAGLSDQSRRQLLDGGRWERVAPSVYGVVDHRRTWIRLLWTAHLHAGPDSTISHESSGRLHRFEQAPAGRVSLIVPARIRHGLPWVRYHRSDQLEPADIATMHGLPVTTRVRTVFDLASVLHVATLRDLVHDEVTEHRLSLARIGAYLDGTRRRGKPGVARLARVLDDLGPGDGLPRSELERLLDEVVRLSGLPTPVHEYPLPGRGDTTGFVDRCWPEARMIVEADGRKWHTRRAQILRDSTRTLAAQAAGYETTRLLWEHLAHDPDTTAEQLQTIHARRLLQRRGSV